MMERNTVILSLLLLFLPLGVYARVEGQDGDKPALEFQETEYTFGTVPRDSVLVHTFRFRNVADTTVRILSAASTCPCVKVEVTEYEIAAGGEGGVTVTFNGSNKFPGRFQQLVRVYTDASPEPAFLELFGTLQKNE
jgi:hypothetical protein